MIVGEGFLEILVREDGKDVKKRDLIGHMRTKLRVTGEHAPTRTVKFDRNVK